MNKNDIKKIIISIVFIVFLVIFFLFGKSINDNKNITRIKIVKSVIKEKYNEVYYENNSDYIYARNDNDYDIYDLNGNKLYKIESNKKLNIIKVMKKYYITYDNQYHLYDSNNILIDSADVIEGLNDYLIRVNDKIINTNNIVLFNDVHTIKSYNYNRHFNINNYYLIDKKGEKILENVIVKKEINNNSFSKYLIIKKENKYYTFFTNIDQIVGDGFDYYQLGKIVTIKNDNNIYKIYKTGLRKKIGTIPSKISNKYIVDNNYILTKKIFVKRKSDNSFGVYDKNNKLYKKITNDIVNGVKRIDNSNYLIVTDNNNYLYNLNKNKVVLKTKYKDDILLFSNGYKSYKEKNKYILLDKNNNKVIELNKQIVINKKIKVGRIDNNFYLYDLKNKKNSTYKKIIINNKIYFIRNDTLYDKNFKEINKNIISYNSNYYSYVKKNKIILKNLKHNKEYTYLIQDGEEISNINFDNVFLVENDNYVKILDDKLNLIKKIKNKKICNFYVTKKKKIILITSIDKDNKIYKGSYLAE